jgi:osmoprotectant transport system ATP-binding protein
MSAIEFREVAFARGEARVLDRLTLTVAAGELLVLLGRSGSGKTTLLKLVNRLLEPTSGTVSVAGRDVRDWDLVRLRRSVGYVIQDGGLFPHMRVAENIATVPRLEAWPRPRIDARVGELLDLVGLPRAFADRWPHELSGGQRQRVGVARALAADPPVLLMDEPFGALDPLTRVELQIEVQRIQQRLRKTIIFVTHDIAEARTLADRIGILDGGALLACGTAAELSESRNEFVRRLLQGAVAPSGAL